MGVISVKAYITSNRLRKEEIRSLPNVIKIATMRNGEPQ